MRVNKTVSAVLATTFAGAVALGGVTAGTAFAADEPRPHAGQQAPQPKAQQLQQQARVLGETADVLKPVAELIDAVVNAPEGRLSKAEADRHAKAVHEALAPLTQQAQQEAEARNDANRAAPAAELATQAAVTLEARVDKLLQAAEAGDQRAIAKQAKATVQAAVNLMAAASADGQLPAADMKGLPKAPESSEDRQNVPQDPKADQSPQLPENKLPGGDAELELLPR